MMNLSRRMSMVWVYATILTGAFIRVLWVFPAMAKTPKMKMTTDIPESIIIPDHRKPASGPLNS